MYSFARELTIETGGSPSKFLNGMSSMISFFFSEFLQFLFFSVAERYLALPVGKSALQRKSRLVSLSITCRSLSLWHNPADVEPNRKCRKSSLEGEQGSTT